MQCPVCDTTLVMSNRNGVEIDYCPSCRGVWLDRGELDKIIERANNYAEPSHEYSRRDTERYTDHDDDDYDRHHHDDNRHGKKHKKEGFLGDLFDF